MGTLNVGTVNAGAGVQLPSYATTNLPTGGIQQGFLAYDSTIGCVKVWNGQKWQKLDEATVNASGGNQVYDFGLYRVHKFTSSGTFNVQDTQNDAKMDFMIVGGGGGGGCSDGNCSNGGGGAGGLVYKSNVSISVGNYPVVVGSGGAGYYNQDTKGDNGGDSSFSGFTALGGGGGGAGEQGQDGSAPRGGNGGDGLLFDIDGINKFYAGGGAGANCNNPTNDVIPGGLGGGGIAAGTIVGGTGGNGYGGGGGGAGYPNRRAGGGGNGVVIIRYPISNVDPTIGQSSGNPAANALQILAANPGAGDGTYWIKPVGYSGSAQQIYCWMSAGGWMLMSSNNWNSSTIPGSTSRRSTSYYLSRSGVLGSPDPNTDYIIGSIITSLEFSAVRVLTWGYGSTNNTTSWNSALSNLGSWVQCEWTLSREGIARQTEVIPRESVLITSSGIGLSSSARFFVLDGIKADNDNGGFNANSNQTTIGGAGVNGQTGDPSTGCYLGHGSSEGNGEGIYAASGGGVDCQGYTTWTR